MATFQSVLRFNGKDNLVEIPYATPVKANQFTVSCWARVQGEKTWGAPVCLRDDSTSNGYVLYKSKGEQWCFAIEGPYTKVAFVCRSIVSLNDWTHLAGTYDGTKIQLYVNGDLVAQSEAPSGSYRAP